MKLTKLAAHSLMVFHVATCLQIHISMELSNLRCVGLYKFHLFLFDFLYKGIMFCHQPLITNGHILLLTFYVSVSRLKFGAFLSP
jgi:hypothetical protein